MKIIEATFNIQDDINGEQILAKLEKAGRTCYKSESKITSESARKFVRSILDSGHESVIEHEKVTVKVICDRGVTHEIVRHRIASYSQESTRYCNYSKSKFGAEITVIAPCFWKVETEKNKQKYEVWRQSVEEVERAYLKLIDLGATPQEARSVLPNSLKTEIIMTMNLREWRHFFRLRTSRLLIRRCVSSHAPCWMNLKKESL